MLKYILYKLGEIKYIKINLFYICKIATAAAAKSLQSCPTLRPHRRLLEYRKLHMWFILYFHITV